MIKAECAKKDVDAPKMGKKLRIQSQRRQILGLEAMGAPAGQLKVWANSGMFLRGPRRRQRLGLCGSVLVCVCFGEERGGGEAV